MSDARTVSVYDEKAEAYDALGGPPDADMAAFAERLPEGGRVLDLGCGPGTAARRLMDLGLFVEAWDASEAMVERALEKGVAARVARFEELKAEAAYDGIWAAFSLLHAPRAALPGLLDRVAQALRPGGWLHLGMKTGSGERRDGLGRFYAFWSVQELRTLLEDRGLAALSVREGEEPGLAGTVDPFAVIAARKDL